MDPIQSEGGETPRCQQCKRRFQPAISQQNQKTQTKQAQRFCSPCLRRMQKPAQVSCKTCQQNFVPTLALHIADNGKERNYFCSEACRNPQEQTQARANSAGPRVIAILNQKGGTGKTTTAVSIAAGLAHVGEPTLLVDLDAQGNVGVSLGLQGRQKIHHLLLRNAPIKGCIQKVRKNLDIITADEGLAAAEIKMSQGGVQARSHHLSQCMAGLQDYRFIILDCAPALSVMNHNALTYADEVLIPVSCDYLALIGVKQVLRSLRRVGEQTGRNIHIAGVLPTFYDVRNRVCSDVLGYLRKSFGQRTLPPVRVNTKLAEAPSHKKTIFEHAPDSNGARDYIRVVEWLRNSASAHPAITRAA